MKKRVIYNYLRQLIPNVCHQHIQQLTVHHKVFFHAFRQAKLSISFSKFKTAVTSDSIVRTEVSFSFSCVMLERILLFIRLRTENERSPSVFATGRVRYNLSAISMLGYASTISDSRIWRKSFTGVETFISIWSGDQRNEPFHQGNLLPNPKSRPFEDSQQDDDSCQKRANAIAEKLETFHETLHRLAFCVKFSAQWI